LRFLTIIAQGFFLYQLKFIKILLDFNKDLLEIFKNIYPMLWVRWHACILTYLKYKPSLFDALSL
jgi:hypothetical protein